MLRAYEMKQALKAKKEAEGILKEIMPKAGFVFNGADNDKIYCHAGVFKENTSDDEIRDMEEKTFFDVDKIVNNLGVLRIEFSVSLKLYK